MPAYQYADAQGHTQEVTHRMLYTTGVVCACGLPMHRVPQATRINWQGGRAVNVRSPEVDAIINGDRLKRVDELAEMKDQHKRDGVTKFKRPLR